MNTLLVPIDGSDNSLKALKAAIDMAKGPGGRLHVINVHPPILSGNVKRFISADVISDYYREESEKALSPAREAIAQAGVQADFKAEVGPVAETIVNYAKDHGCDHIVMGTRGMGLVKGMLLGSVTTKVISLSDVPVTLIK